jgi:hypothetical protein
VTAREYAERLADPGLTPQERIALAREDAEDFLLEAYGELAQSRQGGER